jgi:two-component system OmpR family sensor kinase
MFYLTSTSTTREFSQYVERGNMMYLHMATNNLSRFYSQDGSWSEAQGIISSLLRADSDRLVIADNSGTVVGDSDGKWLGRDLKETGLTNGTPITVSGSEAGKLYLVSSGVGFSPGHMMGMMGRSPMAPLTTTSEQNFLSRIRTNLWLAGLIAVVVALILGMILTRQITQPVRALSKGAHQIAKGKLDYRVNIKSKDEIGELAQSFNSMAVSLHKAEQTRQRLMADIAHELRTPLSIIEGTVDGILDGVFKPVNDNLNSIKEETALLTRLISDLKDLSLAESGQLKLEISPTNIAELVQRKLSQAEMKARGKDIELKLNVAQHIPEINVDPARIEQVVANLIDNAIRHTPSEGSVTVTIDVETSSDAYLEGKPSLMVSVTDTGEGIPADYLPSIFERFYRVESSRSRSSGGVGLGLAIVKQMVEAHGGKVLAESEPGKGSTFYIVLPMANT